MSYNIPAEKDEAEARKCEFEAETYIYIYIHTLCSEKNTHLHFQL